MIISQFLMGKFSFLNMFMLIKCQLSFFLSLAIFFMLDNMLKPGLLADFVGSSPNKPGLVVLRCFYTPAF